MSDLLCEITAGECAVLLEQAANLVLDLKGKVYRAEGPGPIGGVGEQVRHVAEFFAAFLAGIDRGEVDYDARARDPRIEADPTFAGERLAEIGSRLSETVWNDKTLRVRMDDGSTCFTTSSVARELRILASHTVHHFAIIRMLLDGNENRLPAGFGVAPATQRYRAGLADCGD